jgi:glucokinase
MSQNEYPRLISDIGGTNARFCIEIAPYKYENARTLTCRDYASLTEAVEDYLNLTRMNNQIKSAALTMPTPVIDDTILMVNSSWHTFSIRKTRHKLAAIGITSVVFINDWQAMALAIPHIPKNELVQVGGGEPNEARPKAALGPGTGLGMATLIKHPQTNEYLSVTAEGGRSSFAPITEEESNLWRFVHTKHNHVSIERFLSGPGLQLTYEGLCYLNDIKYDTIPTPAEILEKGINATDPICRHTIEIFCSIFGTFASNFAVMVNSFGGVYIGGGIIPRMLEYFINSDFRRRFEAKGRYRPFLEKMPAYVIIAQNPAFLGASYALDTYLHKGYVP